MMLEELQKQIEEQLGELDFNSLSALENPKDLKRKEWLESRKGRFTSSEAVRLMGYEDKTELPDGARTYAIECALEVVSVTSSNDGFNGASIDHGNKYEVEANLVFQEKFGIEVVNFGEDQEFITKGPDFGSTPDGLIKKNGSTEGGTETKCPDSKTHLFYMENLNLSNFKKLCTKYYWQIQTCMYTTGAKYWYFISYDPRFKNVDKRLFVLKIERNEDDISKFRRRLSQASRIKNDLINKYQ